jgi:hypothetical protein
VAARERVEGILKTLEGVQTEIRDTCQTLDTQTMEPGVVCEHRWYSNIKEFLMHQHLIQASARIREAVEELSRIGLESRR